MSEMITALYDCRSKQEYIYRTSKVREIAGASALLSHVYEMFIEKCRGNSIIIEDNWKKKNSQNIYEPVEFSKSAFAESANDGTVIYEGGGNLYILYKNRDVYLKANRIFSKMLLDETYTISIIASGVETSDNFNDDRKALYEQNKYQKNSGTFSIPCNVLPFTQVDRNTWLPVVKKEKGKDYSRESKLKKDAYDKYCKKHDENQAENLDSLVWKKGEESLLAVIYIDGNAMGNKIKSLTDGINDYDSCVNKLREFSLSTNEIYVNQPVSAIEKMLGEKRAKMTAEERNKNANLHKYRKIIGGGDEITIICNARDAKDIILAYFDTLEKSRPLVNGEVNASCAGIAVFHSHAPFSEIYKIAEACCEMGKEKTRANNSKDNYVDFHYCHSGIVNDLETIRKQQEINLTKRPYKVEKSGDIQRDCFRDFCRKIEMLSEIGRQNIKTLRDSAFKGDSYFRFELERILSRYNNGSFREIYEEYKNDKDTLKKIVYDVSLVYDLWKAE
ncbi:MAG: hypothetical protein ACI4JM_05650 [Oscillospiraceae bacterium]